MALTHTQLIDRVYAGLGNRGDRTATIIPWMDMAMEKIARAHSFKECKENRVITHTITGTIATDKQHDISSYGVRNIESLRFAHTSALNQVNKLVYYPNRQWDQLVPNTEEFSTGLTTAYTIPDNFDTLEFYRIPDENWTMKARWWIWPIAVVDDSTSPTLDNKDDIVISYTLSGIFHELGQTEDGKRHFGIAEASLRRAIEQDTDNSDEATVSRGLNEGYPLTGVDPWVDPFVRS